MEILDNQDIDTREKNKDLLLENLSTSAVFSIEILVEKTELVVPQKLKFEYRAKSKEIVLFGIFGLSRIQSMDQNKRFVN